MLETGQPAPDFTLCDQAGNEVTLSSFRGKPVALYFYPKDDTSGCTKQACSFRDRHAELQAKGVIVLGVSPDPVERHAKFVAKYGLNFTLLADPEHTVSNLFGTWGEKVLYGKKSIGMKRTTFLIAADGTIAHIWKKPKTDIHADEVLAKL